MLLKLWAAILSYHISPKTSVHNILCNSSLLQA